MSKIFVKEYRGCKIEVDTETLKLTSTINGIEVSCSVDIEEEIDKSLYVKLVEPFKVIRNYKINGERQVITISKFDTIENYYIGSDADGCEYWIYDDENLYSYFILNDDVIRAFSEIDVVENDKIDYAKKAEDKKRQIFNDIRSKTPSLHDLLKQERSKNNFKTK